MGKSLIQYLEHHGPSLSPTLRGFTQAFYEIWQCWKQAVELHHKSKAVCLINVILWKSSGICTYEMKCGRMRVIHHSRRLIDPSQHKITTVKLTWAAFCKTPDFVIELIKMDFKIRNVQLAAFNSVIYLLGSWLSQFLPDTRTQLSFIQICQQVPIHFHSEA